MVGEEKIELKVLDGVICCSYSMVYIGISTDKRVYVGGFFSTLLGMTDNS